MTEKKMSHKDLVEEGDAHFEEGKFLDSADCYANALKMHPGVATWHAKLAYAQLQLGDRESALKNFEQALKQRPGILAWKAALSELRRQVGSHSKTLEASADYYDELYRSSEKYLAPAAGGIYEPVWSRILQVLDNASCRSVLDVGCGPGQFAEYLLEALPVSYTGFDFSPEAIEKARAKKLKAAFHCDNALSTELYESVESDVIVCTEVLEHIDDDLGVLSRFPTNVFSVCSVPDYVSFGHLRVFSSEDEVINRYNSYFYKINIEKIKISEKKSIFIFYGKTRSQLSTIS